MREKDEFERRREARQKTIRKRRNKRLLIVFFVLAVIIFVLLCLTVLFPVKEIKPSGSKMYSSEEIIKSSGMMGENLFMANEKEIEKKIRRKLPFVGEIKISRSLPGTLYIKVKDAVEYTYYQCSGKFYSVSEKGYVLKEYKKEPQGLIKIVCPDVKCKPGEKVVIGSKKDSETVNSIISSLKEKNIAINSIDVSDPVAIKVRVLDRFDVNFGTSSYLDKKIDHLNGMISQIGEGRKGAIDLSMWTPKKSEGSFFASNN